MLRALVLLACFSPSMALACSIAVPFVSALSPVDGATEVPLNAVMRFIPCRADNPTWQLTDSSGAEVLVKRERRGPMSLLRPDVPLNPSTRYTLTLTDRLGTTVTTTFTTGQSADLAPPAAPGTPSITPGNNKGDLFRLSSCSSSRAEWFTFTWPAGNDDTAPAAEVFVEALLGETEAQLGETPQLVTQTGTFIVGGSPSCGGSYSTSDKGSVVLRARAVDWAGNTSELTEVIPVKNACGCSAGAPGALMLAALAVVVRRGRAHSQRSVRRGLRGGVPGSESIHGRP